MDKFMCHRCGETWPRHPATTVPCPDCHSAVGAACRRPSGHNIPGGDVHTAREKLAVDRGLLKLCTASLQPTETLF